MRTMSFSSVFIPSTGFARWRRTRHPSKSVWAPHPTTIRMAQVSCTAHSRAVVPILPKVSPDGRDQMQTRPPVRNAHIAILTDFTANPLRAMQDRASDPVFAAMLVISALCGALFTGLRVGDSQKKVREFVSESTASVGVSYSENKSVGDPSTSKSTVGGDITWLNISLHALWRLLRKSFATGSRDILQPALNRLAYPSVVRNVRITKISLGSLSPILHDVARVPSRALSDIHLRFGTHLPADPDTYVDLLITVRLPLWPSKFDVPLRVYDLSIDAQVWLALTVEPCAPILRPSLWALTSMPKITFSVRAARLLPVLSIPALSALFTRIISIDLPQKFVLPNATNCCSTPVETAGVIQAERRLSSGDQELRANHPHLTALFDALDIDDDGRLLKTELASGMVEWGLASLPDRDAILTILNDATKSQLQLKDVVGIWPTLQTVCVPRRFRAIVTGTVLHAEGLRTPFIGFTKPYVVISVESQKMRSKPSNLTSPSESSRGSAIWNESWQLYVQQPKTAYLRIEVRESSPWAFYREYLTAPSLPTTHSGSIESENPVKEANRAESVIGFGILSLSELSLEPVNIWVELTTGGGRINVDLQISEFIDPRFVS